jgi:hypothetical protein
VDTSPRWILVEGGQRDGLAGRQRAEPIDGVDAESHVVGPGHAAGGEQRMHLGGQLHAALVGLVYVVDGESHRSLVEGLGQNRAEKPAERGLPRTLCATDTHDPGAAAGAAAGAQPGGQRQIQSLQQRRQVVVDAHRLAVGQESRPAALRQHLAARVVDKALFRGPMHDDQRRILLPVTPRAHATGQATGHGLVRHLRLP